MKKQIFSALKAFDQFSSPINFQLKESQTNRTLLGSFVTLIIFAFVIYAFVQQVLDMVSGQDPTIFIEEQFTPSPELFTFDPSKFTFHLSLVDIEEVSIRQEKNRYLFVPQVRVLTRTVDEDGGFDTVFKPIYLTECNGGFQLDLLMEMKSQINLQQTSYCLSSEQWKNNKLEIEGFGPSEKYKYITIDVMRCKNDTYPGIVCAPEEEIENKLKQGWMGIQFTDQLIKPQNDYPYQAYGKIITASFVLSKLTIVQTYWRHIETLTKKNFFYFFGDGNQIDRSLIFERSEISQGQEIHRDIFASFSILLDDKKNVVHRSYNNILNIFGDIGGLLSVLLLIGRIIVIPFANRIFNLHLAKKLYQSNIKKNDPSAKVIPLKNDSVPELMQLYQDDLDFESIKKFKNETINYLNPLAKQKVNQLKLTPLHYLFGNQEIEPAIQKVNQNFDVVQLMKKIQEINLIKKIIFTKEQKMVFNFLKKPSISVIKYKQLNEDKRNLKQIKKLSNFLRALQTIQDRKNKDQWDEKLIDLIDENIFQLFNQTNEGYFQFLIFQEFQINRKKQLSTEIRQEMPDSGVLDQKGSDQKNLDQIQPDQRQPDQRQPDQRQLDQKDIDQRQPNQRDIDQRQPDQRDIDQRELDQREPDQGILNQGGVDSEKEEAKILISHQEN